MPVRIRMAMHGQAHRKLFHIVAINSKLRRDAKPAELLGIYDPHAFDERNPRVVRWSVDRIRYWLSVGAVPSKSVTRLLELGGILAKDSPFSSSIRPQHPVLKVKTPKAPTPPASS
ncbi:hypothetical protein NLJ89_g6388 [Agrocybe chaxingu]|uniref:Ribosomal protein S16 n=1 Tax=Agrocybe chaxingu TaxID=84603 RepID=A0A9W8JZ90_9AGAR|nr:hypothetical protein NLJ89_g6388 [Agrocybe chaxingu]